MREKEEEDEEGEEKKNNEDRTKKYTIFYSILFLLLVFPLFLSSFSSLYCLSSTRENKTERNWGRNFLFFSLWLPHVVEGLKLEAATGGELAERSKERGERSRDPEKREKNPEKYSSWNIHTGRNTPKSTETAETPLKFTRGGIGGCLVPVCIPVRDFPSVPVGTERNIQLWSIHLVSARCPKKKNTNKQ